MPIAYLSLGSNLDDRALNLKRAIQQLDAAEQTKITKISSLYHTEPIGYTQQPPFLNAVIEIETSLSPQALLSQIETIEKQLGKTPPKPKWGPRVIDIDILLYNNQKIQTQNLQIPHPLLYQRAFVVVPLAEIAPQLKTPQGTPIKQLAKTLLKKQAVKIYNK